MLDLIDLEAVEEDEVDDGELLVPVKAKPIPVSHSNVRETR